MKGKKQTNKKQKTKLLLNTNYWNDMGSLPEMGAGSSEAIFTYNLIYYNNPH